MMSLQQYWQKATDRQVIDIFLVLLLPIFALFIVTLSLPPVDGDARYMLSILTQVDNPLDLFLLRSTMWDTQTYYRPFFLLTFWVPYQLFDVYWVPNQTFNLVLHCFNAVLLYRIIRLRDGTHVMALLTGLLYGISIYTFDSIVWTVSRTGLLVGTMLILVLHHFAKRMAEEKPANIPYLVLLCLLALMSKESGIIVPAIVAFAGLNVLAFKIEDWRLLAVGVGIIVVYFIFRVVVFGSIAGTDSSYEVSPILLLGGQDYYQLPPTPTNSIIAKAEIITKNIIGVFFPVFNNQGVFFPLRRYVLQAPLFLLTALAALAITKRPTRFQQIGLAIILANAVVHFSFYAYYLLYLGFIGLCIFIGTSKKLEQPTSLRYQAALVLSVVVLFASAFNIARNIHLTLLSSEDQLERIVENAPTERPTDPAGIIQFEISQRYGR